MCVQQSNKWLMHAPSEPGCILKAEISKQFWKFTILDYLKDQKVWKLHLRGPVCSQNRRSHSKRANSFAEPPEDTKLLLGTLRINFKTIFKWRFQMDFQQKIIKWNNITEQFCTHQHIPVFKRYLLHFGENWCKQNRLTYYLLLTKVCSVGSEPTTPLKSPKFAAQTFLTWNSGSTQRVANRWRNSRSAISFPIKGAILDNSCKGINQSALWVYRYQLDHILAVISRYPSLRWLSLKLWVMDNKGLNWKTCVLGLNWKPCVLQQNNMDEI